jgi:hypothetical protein
MCVCGWQLIVVTLALVVLVIGYGEIEGRRRARANDVRSATRPPDRFGSTGRDLSHARPSGRRGTRRGGRAVRPDPDSSPAASPDATHQKG